MFKIYLLEFIVLVAVFLFFRIWLIKIGIKNNSFTDGDAINHLEFLRQIYEHNGRIPNKIEKYILDTNDYPNGYYKLLYMLRITPEFANKYGGYISLFSDIGTIVLVCISMFLWGGTHYWWVVFLPFLGLWLAHVGRAFYFSPRPFGVFVTNLFLFGAVGYFMGGNPWFLLVAMVGFIGFSTSSQFGWQAGTFFSFLLGIYEPIFFIVYLCSFIASAILTKGYSITVLKGLLRHSHFYKTYLVKIHPGTIQNKYVQIYNFFRIPSLKSAVELYRNNSILAFFSLVPLHLIVVYYFVFLDSKIDIFAVWFFAGAILVLLISTESLKFLGEPERYLEYSIIPVFVILANIDFSDIVVLTTVVVVLSILNIVYFTKSVFDLRTVNSQKEDAIRQLLSFMSTIGNATVLTIPIRLSFMLGYFHETNRYAAWFANIGVGELGVCYRELIPDRYAFPGSDINKYIQAYKVQYIVAEKAGIRSAERLLGSDYYSELLKHEIVFENEFYAVYAVKIVLNIL